MDELDEYSQELMLNFLHANFPVERLKDGRRFKRGIIIHGDFIGDEAYIEMLAEKINEAVETRDVYLISSNAKFANEVL